MLLELLVQYIRNDEMFGALPVPPNRPLLHYFFWPMALP